MARVSFLLEILAYIIAVSGYAPLVPFLEPVPRYLLPLALILGLVGGRKGVRMSGPLPTFISILFFVYYAAQFSRENIAGPAVNLLIVLLSIRLVSEKKVRHYLQIFALSLFSLAGSSLFTLDLNFLVYLILLFFLIAAALVILTFHAADDNLTLSGRGARILLSVAFLIPAGALPLMCIFFIVLPRTQYPLWNFLNAAGTRVAGFSEKVEPGASPSVGEVRKAAFRATCERLAQDQLYWRSTVLNSPAGNAWIRGELRTGETGRVAMGRGVHQTIYPESVGSGFLPALNVPARVDGIRASLTGDHVLRTAISAGKRVKYDAVSFPVNTIATRNGIDRSFYLRLPRSLSPRLLAVAGDIAQKGKNDQEKLELLKQYYLSQNLSYATSGLPVSADPLDEFLFGKKRGNCEFFASSFALLLRMIGVPSRLVCGYLGGEYNELGGYYLVTEDMAHVWVEAYLTDRGWVMTDPSALSADFRSARRESESGFAYRLRTYLDTCSYCWNIAVLAYDLEKQIQLAGKIDFRMRHFSLPAHPWKKLIFAGSMLIFLIPVVILAKRIGISREEKVLQRFLREIKRKYAPEILPSTGLHELADLSNDPRINEFVAVYSRAVYRDRKLSDAEYRLLRELLRGLSRKTG